MTLVPRSIAKLSSHRLLRGSSKGAEEEGGRHPERKLGGASSGCVSGGFGLDDDVVHTALGVCLVQTGLCGDKASYVSRSAAANSTLSRKPAIQSLRSIAALLELECLVVRWRLDCPGSRGHYPGQLRHQLLKQLNSLGAQFRREQIWPVTFPPGRAKLDLPHNEHGRERHDANANQSAS